MENYLRLLMDTVDDLSQDTNKYHNYQKMHGKQQQAKEAQLTKRVSGLCRLAMKNTERG